MSKWTMALVAALAVTLPVFAEDAPKKKEASAAQKAHRARMSACSKDAKSQSLKGDERKAFMKQCLSDAKSAAQRDAGKPQ